MEDAFDETTASLGNLFQLSPVFHGTPEADRYGTTCRTIYQEGWRVAPREPEESREGQEDHAGSRPISRAARPFSHSRIRSPTRRTSTPVSPPPFFDQSAPLDAVRPHCGPDSHRAPT